MIHSSKNKECSNVTGEDGIEGAGRRSHSVRGPLCHVLRGRAGRGPRRRPGDGIHHGRKNQKRYDACLDRRSEHHPGGSDRPGGAYRGGYHHPEGYRVHSPLRLVVTPLTWGYNRIGWKWSAGVFVILALLFMCCVPSLSFADGSSPGISEDMKILDTDLEANSTLSDFSTFSAEHQLEDNYALAELGSVESSFIGSDPALSFLAPSPSGPYIPPIEELIHDIKTGEEFLIPGGSSEEAIGGELADTAASAGIIPPLSLIPIAGALAYEDIVSGSNIVYRKLFSGEEDYKKIEERGGVAAEKERWQAFAAAPPTGCSKWIRNGELCRLNNWTEQTEVETCGEFAPSQSCLEAHNEWKVRIQIYFPNGGVNVPFGLPEKSYYLEYEVGGEWWIGTLGFVNGEATMYGEWPWIDGSDASGCFVTSVAGAPAHLSHIATTLLIDEPFPPTSGCTGTVEHVKFNLLYTGTVGARTPSRMHEGLPRITTEPAIKKLEEEGHEVVKSTGSPAKSAPEVKTRVKKIVEKEKEGGQKRQKEAFCFWMGCEKHSVEPQPETPQSPPTPGKAEGIPPSLPGTEEIPSCFLTELSGTQCKELLESDGFTKVEIDVRTWEHAVVTKPAEAVVSVNPAAGSHVETSSKIIVESNPDAANMPALVPAIKYGSETGTQFKERLEKEGWTKVEISILPETSTDPHIGPSQASYTVPKAGSAEAPTKEAEITIETNSPDAPAPAEGSEGISGPTLPGFHLPNFGVTCKGFPFGVPCWLIKTIESWSATATCPQWGLGKFSIKGHEIPEATFDTCHLEPLMEKVRPAMLIFSTIGLVILFFNFAKGGGAPSGGGARDLSGSANDMPEPDEGVYL